MKAAKISSKNQLVVPKPMREALGIKGGDKVFFVLRKGVVYLLPHKKSLADALKGIARGRLRYPAGYLKGERSSW